MEQEKPKRGRKLIYLEGYKQNMIDSKYHQKYYHENKHVRTNCYRCGKDICQLTYSSHLKTKKCLAQII